MCVWLGGELAAVMNSPFVVPVAGCMMIASISVAGIWSGVRNKEIRSHERLAMIAQGILPEPEPLSEATARNDANALMTPRQAGPPRLTDGSGMRRAGLILCGAGFGFVLFFLLLAIVVHVREVLAGAAVAMIPVGLGAGFLVDAQWRRREFDRAVAEGRLQAPVASAPPPLYTGQAPLPGLTTPATAPPAGAELTPAQASDWRPFA